jgi:hypothetical protein
MNHDSSERTTAVRPLEKPSRSTGPKTPNDRIHSLWNALKHRFGGAAPDTVAGEDVATYERKADQIFLTLDPQTPRKRRSSRRSPTTSIASNA